MFASIQYDNYITHDHQAVCSRSRKKMRIRLTMYSNPESYCKPAKFPYCFQSDAIPIPFHTVRAPLEIPYRHTVPEPPQFPLAKPVGSRGYGIGISIPFRRTPRIHTGPAQAKNPTIGNRESRHSPVYFLQPLQGDLKSELETR